MTVPSSKFKNKSNSIVYHHVCEDVDGDECRTTYINTHENPEDLLTKALPPGPKRDSFCLIMLHHIIGKRVVPSDPTAAAAALYVTKSGLQ